MECKDFNWHVAIHNMLESQAHNVPHARSKLGAILEIHIRRMAEGKAPNNDDSIVSRTRGKQGGDIAP